MKNIITYIIFSLLLMPFAQGEAEIYEVFSLVDKKKTFSAYEISSETQEFENIPLPPWFSESEKREAIKNPKCSITMYSKGKKLLSFSMKEKTLENAYNEALNEEEPHPFFGMGKSFFLFNTKTKASFYVFVENQHFTKEGKPYILNGINRRFRIGPLENLAGEWYVVSSALLGSYKLKFPIPFYDVIAETKK